MGLLDHTQLLRCASRYREPQHRDERMWRGAIPCSQLTVEALSKLLNGIETTIIIFFSQLISTVKTRNTNRCLCLLGLKKVICEGKL